MSFRSFALVAAVALLVTTATAFASQADAPTKKQFLVQFSLGPAWLSDKPPHEQTAFADHGRNLKRLRDAGQIALGARYADKGMIVLLAPDEAAARAEMDADPGVVAGIFRYELHELRVFYEGAVVR